MVDTPVYPVRVDGTPAYHSHEGKCSAISWGTVIGGSVTMIAVSGILLTFGAALGFAPSSSPMDSGHVAAVTAGTAIALVLTQWIASGVGGYLTGRMRTKWVSVHSHEVFFRDTAHGFLSWAVALIFGGLLIASGTAIAGSAAARMHGMGHGPQMSDNGPMGNYVDKLYRGSAMQTPPAPDSVAVNGNEPGAPAGTPPAQGNRPMGMRLSPDRMESERLLTRAMAPDGLPADDKAYLTQMVSERTGLSNSDASARVDAVIAQEKDDAAKARKIAALTALFTGLSMLIGAFVAAAAAAFGGSQRDEWEESVRVGTYVER